MKRIFSILLSLLIARSAQAQLDFLSSNQNASVSGNVCVHDLSSNFTFSANSGNVSGNITVTDPNPDQYGFSGMMAGFQSSANLLSGQSGGGGLFCNSQVSARGFGPFDGSGGNGNGNATSSYQVSFSVSSPQPFQMSVSNFNFSAPRFGAQISNDFTFTLSSANQGFIGGWSSNGQSPSPGGSAFSGLLEPGDIYTFQDVIEAAGQVEDPNSETASVGADVTLSLVPEPPAAWMLGMGVVALGAMRLRQGRGRQV